MSRNRITTHILDTSIGKPAANVKVHLLEEWDTAWSILGKTRTDADGRTGFIPTDNNKPLQAGNYKIMFFIEQYFQEQDIDSFYPWVEIAFKLPKNTEHYHIPLLISPYGFTTYRGS